MSLRRIPNRKREGRGSLCLAAILLAFHLSAGVQAKADSGLETLIMKRAAQVAAQIHNSGGYRFDGSNDCYGFMRRVWDPVLGARGAPGLPVADFVSRNWQPIRSWSALRLGDVLATHQGHRWGEQWHGGLFNGFVSGKAYIFDNSYANGPMARVAPAGLFHYYYRPTHDMLGGSNSAQGSSTMSQASKTDKVSDKIPGIDLKKLKSGAISNLSISKTPSITSRLPAALSGAAQAAKTSADNFTAGSAWQRFLSRMSRAGQSVVDIGRRIVGDIAGIDGAAGPVKNLGDAGKNLLKGNLVVQKSPQVRSSAAPAKSLPASASQAPAAAATQSSRSAASRAPAPPLQPGGIFGMNIDPANPAGFPSDGMVSGFGLIDKEGRPKPSYGRYCRAASGR